MSKTLRTVLAIAVCLSSVSMLRSETIIEGLKRFKRTETPEGLLIEQTPKEMEGWTRSVEVYGGLNCPVPKALYDEGEDASGVVWRLECKSKNGSSSWRIRIIWRSDGHTMIVPW